MRPDGSASTNNQSMARRRSRKKHELAGRGIFRDAYTDRKHTPLQSLFEECSRSVAEGFSFYFPFSEPRVTDQFEQAFAYCGHRGRYVNAT